MGVFDKKLFNSEVFAKYVESIPKTKNAAFKDSGVLVERADLVAMFPDQVGGNYAVVPMTGRIGGTPKKYDGTTSLTDAKTLSTYKQGVIVIGHMDEWVERDFSFDVTGKDFMEVIAGQTSEYWDEVDNMDIVATLKGIFGVTDAGFNTSHTYDITSDVVPTVSATTLNSAIQKASGDNKSIFALAVMNSAVSTTLENLNLLEYRKYTDEQGIQRDLSIADWNGRTVIITDDGTTQETETTAGVYTVTVGGTVAEGDVLTVAGKSITLDSTSAASVTAAATAMVTALGTMDEYTITRNAGVITFTEKTGYYSTGAPTASIVSTAGTVTVATATEPVIDVEFVTYVLGKGAIEYGDCGAKVPVETERDARAHGGEEYLIMRQRKFFAPKGFSFINTSIVSPTLEELADASNWSVVKSADESEYYPSKAIPFARIISLG